MAMRTTIYPYPDCVAAVKKVLNLPEQVILLDIISIGYPAEQKSKENRYHPSRLHQNRW
jgi:hypothetical protein